MSLPRLDSGPGVWPRESAVRVLRQFGICNPAHRLVLVQERHDASRVVHMARHAHWQGFDAL